jgi:nitrite reductase (cytochrome c-552)
MIMADSREPRFSIKWLVAAAAIAAAITLGLAALLTNIFQRQQEARNPFYRVVELTDTTIDPAIWGRNFPLQYDDYLRTVDQSRTRYGGSEAMPRDSTSGDPRTQVAQSRLDEDPRLREFWAGYAFARDFREERGHAYMLADQVFTERQQVTQQPGTCLHCHASLYVAYKREGGGDLIKGFEALNPLPYAEAKARVGALHPVACIDCHDPSTMALRVTRPGFIEGIRALKASEGIADYDVTTSATRHEMRTYVCAQCHVEYYFQGPGKRLTYPWAKGLKADSILAYYEENGHKDWTHAISGAPALKAQHPEFELYSQGIHARSGVACADCHMPYKRQGAMKISDHHVRSPLLNIEKSCQTCHHWEEQELRNRVHTIQDRTYELRNLALDAVLELTREIGALAKSDSGNSRLAVARQYQRKAQFLTDFIEAENSMGFHAGQEAARILAHALNYSRLGHAAITGEPVQLPGKKAAPPQVVSPGTAPLQRR